MCEVDSIIIVHAHSRVCHIKYTWTNKYTSGDRSPNRGSSGSVVSNMYLLVVVVFIGVLCDT